MTPIMSDKQKEATSFIVEQLAQSGIKLVASLPDDWIAPLIDAVDKDDRFQARTGEPRGVGDRSLFRRFFRRHSLSGSDGSLRIDDLHLRITKINYSYHIPLFIFATLRGVIGDPRPHHISNGSLPDQASWIRSACRFYSWKKERPSSASRLPSNTARR